MKKLPLAVVFISMLGFGGYAAAEQDHMSHAQDVPAVTQEYMKAMDDMHKPMMAGVMDQNPDAAFVKGMIPHHQGAIDMATIELKYGTDPELRELAQEIIKAQEKEITFMQEWLKKYQNSTLTVEE